MTDRRMRPLDRAILVAAPAMGLFLVLEVAFIWLFRPDWGHALLGLGIAQGMFGREAGIPTAMAAGAPSLLVLQVSSMLDLAMGGTVYGLIVAFTHGRSRLAKRAHELLDNIRERAKGKRGFIEQWGPPGAFLVMLVPFLINGPLVIAMAGRLAGLTSRQLIAPIASATVVAAAMWISFSQTFLGLAATAGERAIWIVPVVCAMAAVATGAWRLLAAKRARAGDAGAA